MQSGYSKVQNESRQSNDSFELASLVSSSEIEADSQPSRGSSDRLSHLDYEDDEDLGQNLSFDSSRRPSVSASLFEYGNQLYPLAASTETRNREGRPLEKQKHLGLFSGLALVIGVQIGSGIFSSPSEVDASAGSPGASIIVWLVAGLLVWTGAASYAELGSAIPLNGGPQAYLHHIFGPLLAFLFAWAAITILKPGSTAIVAIVFAEYVGRVLYTPVSSDHDLDKNLAPVWFTKVVAISVVMLITMINMISSKLGARTGNVLLVLKIGALVAITIIGAIYRIGGHDSGNFSEGWFSGSSNSIGDYAIALYAGLWAFDGWDNLNYVAAEMKNTSRDIPRVIHIAMPIVIVCYLATNLSYYAVLPSAELKKSSAVALAFGEQVMGKTGAIVFTVCIAASCFGAINAMMYSSARLIYVSGKDGFIPLRFGKINRRTETPVNALILQAALTIIFVFVGEFKTLLVFYGVAGYMFYFVTVLGVIVLRVREPKLDRPYKTFIITPILFCCVALFLISRGVFSAPIQSLFVGAFILAGIPIYYWRAGGGLYQMPVLGKCFRRSQSTAIENQPLPTL
ncbi:amino acid permease-domain-containing protein [Dipodascopsis uninucleata]